MSGQSEPDRTTQPAESSSRPLTTGTSVGRARGGSRARFRRRAIGALALGLLVLCLFAIPDGRSLGQVAPRRQTRRAAVSPLRTSRVVNPITGRLNECVAGEVLVQFRRAAPRAARIDAHASVGARVLSRIPQIGVERVACPEGKGIEETISAYRKRPEVAYAEPNWIMRALERPPGRASQSRDAPPPLGTRLLPNDPRFSEQYGPVNIAAPAAWDTQTGCSNIVIAIVDTGVNLTHEDLQANIWENLDETPGNGIDDDGNGKVDDRFGWDFVDNDNDPNTEDDSGDGDKHGTHVAGIAAAIGNNGVGVAGVVWNCKIMAVRVLDANGNGTVSGVMDGMVYAAENGAQVINMSIGGGYSSSMQTAVDFAYDHDAVLCVAMGNDGEEITTSTSTWQSPVCNDGVAGTDNKILGVAAVDRNDAKPGWSNYSAAYSFCDVSAPGVDILSTWWPTGYGTTSGTSMATPYVAGLAAMLRCQFPGDTNQQIMARIRGSTDSIDAINPAVAGKLGTGRINAYNALQPPHPGPVAFVSHRVDDDSEGTSNGDGDLLVEPGESIELKVTVRNQGMLQADNVRATLTTATPGITITDDAESFGNVPAFSTAETLDDFDFTVAPTVPLGSVIDFEMTVEANSGGPWVSQFTVRAGRGPFGEPDDTCPQAAPVPTDGTPVQRHFEVAGDHDWFKFTATQGATYVIETSELGGSSGSSTNGAVTKDMQTMAVDTVMRLVDVDCGAQLAFDDDGGSGFASRIEWTAPASGVYSVEVWDFKGNTGAYSLSIGELVPGPVVYVGHEIDDDNLGASSGNGDGIIDPGERIELSVTVRNQGTAVTGVQGTLSTTTPGISVTRDTEAFGSLGFQATATTGEPYLFTVAPGLPAGTPIAFALTTSATGAGPWVSQFQSVVGRDEFGEPDDTCAIAVEAPTDGTVINRRFEVLGDHDWIKFQALAGVTYVIETGNLGSLGKAQPPGGVTPKMQAAMADTFLRLVDTDCQTTLVTNDDISFPDNLASRIEWTAAQSGTYSAEVSCWSDSCTGTYTISVTGELSSISGTITADGGGGIEGVEITAVLGGALALDGEPASASRRHRGGLGAADVSWQTTTGPDGAYTIESLPAGDYTITPSHADYVFSPLSRAATIPPAAVGMDFMGAPPPGIVVDADPATPDVYESEITATTGAEVVVDVVATQVTDLDEYDFKLVYSPDKLSGLDASDGPFLGSLGGATSFAADLSTPGEVHITNALVEQDPALAPDGSGVIAHVRLQVLAQDACGAITPTAATFTDTAAMLWQPIPQGAQVCGDVRGDFDGDHDVDVDDLALLRAHWGAARQLPAGKGRSPSCEPYDERFDVNDDGLINLDDFFLVWRDNPTAHTRWVEGDVTGDEAVAGCGEAGYPAAGPDDWLDVWDLIAFANHWQTQSGGAGWDPVFDFAGPGGVAPPESPAVPVDGVVSIHDLVAFVGNWHTGDGPAPLVAAGDVGLKPEGAGVLLRGADTAGLEITAEDDVVVAGDEVRAAVVARRLGAVRAYDVRLTYDAEALALEDVEVGDALEGRRAPASAIRRLQARPLTSAGLGASGIYLTDARTPGLVWLTGAATDFSPERAAPGGALLAELTFRAQAVERTTALRAKSVRVWGESGDAATLAGEPAAVRVVNMRDGDWRAEIVVKAAERQDGGHYFGVVRAVGEKGTEGPLENPYVSRGVSAPFSGRGPTGVAAPAQKALSPFPELLFHRGDARTRSHYRSADAREMQFVFDVEAPGPDQEVTLLLPDVSQVPRRYGLLLTDVAAGRTVSLRTQSAYRYRSAAGRGRRFVLAVTERPPGRLRVTGLTIAPIRGAGVVIEYQLSRSAAVSVDILNVAGVRVRGLARANVEGAGRHATPWDERSEHGTVVPSGTYLVRVEARDEAASGAGPGGETASALGVVALGR